ncbi:DMT family transporter [Salipaludibacillus sp. CUR1]|uniref:DMT family transporter n=1 Tax=Salipaludibacillus sp. CUR1 TaxID=2820003 RepID=UPI001E2CD6D1|nr:DMT family transporter [Salipaludibacillus sp. CUR1]MCE7791515.1 DMT family transporter [Salipaludibacillus sp. CUR1]
MNRTLLGVLCLSLAGSLWGGLFVFTKYVLDYIPLFTLIWLRYMIGFLVLYFLLKWHQKKYGQRKSYTKNDWLVLIRLGFIGYCVTIVGQYTGVELSNASTGALIILSVLYLGIAATAGTFYLWNKGMELMDASVGSLFLFFQPLVGGLLGWLWLNETIGLDFLAGGLLIMLGIVIATWKHKSKRY